MHAELALSPPRIKKTDASKLQDEYQKLVQGLQEQEVARDEDQWLSNPILPEDILKEAIPGNIRRAEHFTAFLARFVEYLKVRISHDPHLLHWKPLITSSTTIHRLGCACYMS